jgi:hypothetical protein
MANLVDPRNLPEREVSIPGLKPPIEEFVPSDDADPSEVDRFNAMVRELRNQNSAEQTDGE